jgi:hypothetical protein
MLTDQLSHIIVGQLKQEPLVVLPSFGGFVKDHAPASLDEKRNRVHPPMDTVIFNAKLSHNDGMLLAAASQELEITYSAADKWLTDAISEIRFRLNNGETVKLDGLGELKTSTEGMVEFKAVGTPAIQDEFFGLKPISLSPVEKDNVDKLREAATKVRTLPIKRIASYAAAAIAVGFMVWLPIQNGALNNGKMLVHQLNPLAETTESSYKARHYNDEWLSKGFEQKDALADKFKQEYLKVQLVENSNNVIVVRTDAIPSEELTIEEEAPTAETEIATAASYKVIAATFGSKGEAADYVAKMIKRGFGAEYAGTENGNHLVAYGTYDSLDDANKMLKSVSLSNKEARIVAGS